MNRSSLGVLGGMGPHATAVFMERVIGRTEVERDQDHIDMVVLNHASLPDRTSAIRSDHATGFLGAVSRDLKLLELADVANIAVPCNTAHYFYPEMQRMTRIPIIHMTRETMLRAYHMCGTGARIGLLATEGTIQSGIYEEACEPSYGMELIVPGESLQRQVTGIIYEQVKRSGDLDPGGLCRAVLHMISHLGCDLVVLACTELSCIPLIGPSKARTLDAMDVLAERAIVLSGGVTRPDIPASHPAAGR